MNFKSIPSTQFFEGYCIIRNIEQRTTSKGSQYLDMTLADTDGEIVAKLWDYHESAQFSFSQFDFVKVRGSYVTFNDSQQFRVDKIRKVTPDDDVNIDDYVPSAVLSGEVMLLEIGKIVSSFEDEELKRLVTAVIGKYKDKLIYWPAAKNLHHAVRSGLLMHTLTILRMAYSLCQIYSYVNYDLLCAGIILHDILKTEELDSNESGIGGDYTVKGNLIGHLVMGAIEIDEMGKELGISDETLMLLEHMLISHHGIPEFGAAKYPMFIEAFVLAALDDMDAKLYEISNALENVEAGKFSGKQWALDNRILYNHGRSNEGNITLL